MRFKKSWAKPELRPLRLADEYDPADGLTRRQWEAARELKRRLRSGELGVAGPSHADAGGMAEPRPRSRPK